MSTKALTIVDAIQGKGCLGKALPDEPVFILRAKDRTAPGIVLAWADEAEKLLEKRKHDMTFHAIQEARNKIDGAREVAGDMIHWQRCNPHLVKDPD